VGEPIVTYQDATCISARASRSVGTDTDQYEVVMTSAAFAGLSFDRPGNLYDDVGQKSAVQGPGRVGDTKIIPLAGGIRIRGDLILFDGVSKDAVTISNLYVRDDGIEEFTDPDDETGPTLIKLSLVDIRYFWPKRGELWGTYNLTTLSGWYDPGTVHVSIVNGDTPTPTQETTPWSLHEIIDLILTKLPGRPRLELFPPSIDQIAPPNVKWEGENPKKALDFYLAKYKLSFALSLNGNARLYDYTEADPAAGKEGARRVLNEATLPAGSWQRRLRKAFQHVPQAVRLVGPPVVREIEVDGLDPVGFRLGEDTHLPVENFYDTMPDAAASYGLTIDDLARFVLIPDKDQASLIEAVGGDPQKRVHEINRWAFRAFRVPDAYKGFLPILPQRARALLRAAKAAAAGSTVDQNVDPSLREPPTAQAEIFVEQRQRAAAAPTLSTPGATIVRPSNITPEFTGQDSGL
jgi:hypothetical protein